MNPAANRWFCAQAGAREHYAVPTALSGEGCLDTFVTDIWNRGSLRSRLFHWTGQKRLKGRFHSDVQARKIVDWTWKFLRKDFQQKVFPRPEFEFHMARNAMFDRLCSTVLRQEFDAGHGIVAVFAYCNACRDLFTLAKSRGLKTVLGQFDPGPAEARIVTQECLAYPQFQTPWKMYPQSYTDGWREELAKSDYIVVNSEWSRECLISEGIPDDRIRVFPLVYQARQPHVQARVYPERFDRKRPLRILFLGQVILRKGIARLVDTMRLLKGESVLLDLVGPTDIQNLAECLKDLPVQYRGNVARDDVHRYYQEADVFILPTLSDGFAITQLEAQTWKLPLLVSRYCGTVVEHDRNGWILDDLQPETIARSIGQWLREPAILKRMSDSSRLPSYGYRQLARDFQSLIRS